MIIPEIKQLFNTDIDDLDSYHPTVSDCFEVIIEAHVGEIGKDGSDIFSFTICTPKYLESLLLKDTTLVKKHIILVNKFSYKVIESRIVKLISSIQGETWDDFGNKLSKFADWEYEGCHSKE